MLERRKWNELNGRCLGQSHTNIVAQQPMRGEWPARLLRAYRPSC